LDKEYENSGEKLSKTKLNAPLLEEVLDRLPPPDSYSFDFIWEKPWQKIFPKSKEVYTFHKNGHLVLADDEDNLQSHDVFWTLNPHQKQLTVESVNHESSFEIQYDTYRIKYLTSDWMILQVREEDEDIYTFQIFSTILEFEKDVAPLQQLFKDLEGDSASEKPNMFLILIFGVVIFLILILIFSL